MSQISRRRKSGIAIGAVGLITLLVFLYLDQTHEQNISRSGDDSQQTLLYDAWSDGLRTVRYNEQGHPEYILAARRQVHYIDNRSEVELPELQLYENEQLRWQVRAESGRIFTADGDSTDIRQLDLADSVRVEYSDGAGQAVVLTTEFLTLEPGDRLLYTDEQVHLESTGFAQTSRGIRADLSRDHVDFPEHVEGRYHSGTQQPDNDVSERENNAPDP